MVRRKDADLERELRSDLELEEEEQRENRVPATEARYAARRAFGNPTLIREQTHEIWGRARFERLWRDIRFALRQMRRGPGFTSIVVAILALGIGGNSLLDMKVDDLCGAGKSGLLEGLQRAVA